jgi:hypothetical protein
MSIDSHPWGEDKAAGLLFSDLVVANACGLHDRALRLTHALRVLGWDTPTFGAEKPDVSWPSPTAEALRALADKIRSEQPRQRKVPAFLELMVGRKKLTFEEIAESAHRANVEDSAIEKTVLDARRAIEGERLPLLVRISERHVYITVKTI